ncbi:hypothetical protein [Enemella sp. A6]|uniref:hypothetical protein n=1 Tax=Enemella sp. A6 TaxID=3440152 RepID=UPI003EC09126
MRTPWWFISRWQAFVAVLLVGLSFLTVWIGMTYSYTLTNYTVHEPGEVVSKDGITYKYLGMVRSQVGTGGGRVQYAAPGMTYVAVVVEVTIDEGADAYCPLSLIDAEQTMSWFIEQSHVLNESFRSSCMDATPGEPTQVVTVFEVPSSQAENVGGVMLGTTTWRALSEVIR